MPRSSKSNVSDEPLRWSLEKASVEFNLSIPTLRSSLVKNSIVPGEDHCYSTRQLVESLYGALHLEKVRTQRELTRKYSLENRIVEASVLDRASLSTALAGIADSMKHRILNSELSQNAKTDLLTELSSIPIMLAQVAQAQTKLPRRNGKRDDDED